MRIILILTAWVGLDFIFVGFMWFKAKRRFGKCFKCRYVHISSGRGQCSLLGTPSGCKECKYFETWEEYKCKF